MGVLNDSTIDNITLINGKSKVSFASPLLLDQDKTYYVALKNCAIPYSWYNISKQFSNNKFKYFNPETSLTEEITIEDGNHDCDTLNFQLIKYFQTELENLPIIFNEVPGINRIGISLKKGWKIDFTDYKIRKLLGFESRIYNEIDNIAPFPARIEREVRLICIHCNLVQDSFIHNVKENIFIRDNIIFSFVPNKAPSDWLIFSPNPLKKFRINYLMISEIEIEITDQKNRDIDFNGEKCSITLDISTNII
jgi:hypothetical protein